MASLKIVSELSSRTQEDDCGDARAKGGSWESLEIKEIEEQVKTQRRPSVRDLASKFEKSQEAKAAEVAKVAMMPAMDNDFELSGEENELQKLRRILVDLSGRVEGRTKDDVEEALSTAESLEAICIQRGTELAQQRQGKMRNLASLFKQVAIDAKAMLEETRSLAQAEIESARETVSTLQNFLQEHYVEQIRAAPTEREELEDLKNEAHEGQRIKMLHESSTAADMEHQVGFLRQQLLEKAAENVILRRLLKLIKARVRDEGEISVWYELAGDERLGSTLSIVLSCNKMVDLSQCTIQWYQITDGSKATDLIPGAISSQYAPEPLDVGRILRVEISFPGGKAPAVQRGVQTLGPIKPLYGLVKYVESLAGKGGGRFSVRIVLKNGEIVKKRDLHTLDVDENRIELYIGIKTHVVEAKAIYSTAMQLCGARGRGDSAARGLFWVPTKDETFLLVLESERERNAAIMLARKFAKLQNIVLEGPASDSIRLEATNQ